MENVYPRLVSWSYYSGYNYLTGKNGKEITTKIYIKDEKGEEIIKRGNVAVLNDVDDPYFYKTKNAGFNSRAKSYGKEKYKLSMSNPNEENNLKKISKRVMDYGDFVYIDLVFLSNYTNSMYKGEDGTFYSLNFIYKDKFTVDFVIKLLEYKPLDCYYNEITSYKEKELPEFLKSLKYEFPEMYAELLKKSEIAKDLDKNLTFVGKEALLNTLENGKVEVEFNLLNKEVMNWDGKLLTSEIVLRDGSTRKQTIEPSEDTKVIIVDDNTVNEDTVIFN